MKGYTPPPVAKAERPKPTPAPPSSELEQAAVALVRALPHIFNEWEDAFRAR